MGGVLRLGQSRQERRRTFRLYLHAVDPLRGDAAELPYLSYVEQIRPGAGVVLDRQAVGLAVEGFQITVGSGPGRANSKISVELVGSGKVIDSATGITMPAATTEKLLPSASLTLSINGIDYVTNKNIVSLETGWKNNIRMDAGFFPGSGFQTAGDGSTGAIRGRLEFGNRAGNLKFVARFMNGSDEYTKLKAQTSGTAVITLAYDVNNSLQLTWQKITYSVVEIAETDQVLTVAVECLPMYDSSNGILTAVGKTTVDAICQSVDHHLGWKRRMATDFDRDVTPIRVQDMKRIVVYIRHRLLRFDVIVLSHIPNARLRAAHQDEKQSLFHLGRLQMLLGNIVFAFSGPAVDHGNLMGFRIPTDAATEAARQAH